MKIDEKMSPRERLLLFSTIELLRKEIQPKFSDWKDADDWLFSQLDFTKDELAQIYKGRNVIYHDASAVDFEVSGRSCLDNLITSEKILKAINIKWDVDYVEDAKMLPKEIEIPKGMTDEEEISDYLSDVTGFCHEGFVLVEAVKIIESNTKQSLSSQIQAAKSKTVSLSSDNNPPDKEPSL